LTAFLGFAISSERSRKDIDTAAYICLIKKPIALDFLSLAIGSASVRLAL